MTLRISRLLGDREVGKDEVWVRLNREVLPVLKELVQKANLHVEAIGVTAAEALPIVRGRILLVDIDDAHDQLGALPDEHVLGDEIRVTSADGLTWTYMSDGVTWRRLADAGGLMIQRGAGDPNGVHDSPLGTLFLSTTGGAGTTLWVKETAGFFGWAAK